MGPAVLLIWLGLAAFAQVLMALFGVLSRFLQTQTEPPMPALRLLLIFNVLGVTTLAVFDLLSLAAAACKRRWQRRQQRRQRQRQHECEAAAGSKQVEVQIGGSAAGELAAKPPSAAGGDGSDGSSAKLDGSSSDAATAATDAQQEPEQEQQEPAAAVVAEWQLARPQVPLQRGLSRRFASFESRRPTAHRRLAFWATASSISLACGCQLVAPGFVDPSIVQLINTCGVLVVVFIQAALLDHRLPPLVWPCSVGTVAGAGMVLVPSVGQGTDGGLDSPRAWLGFGLSVAFMLAAAVMYICLQAFRRLAFKSSHLLYAFMSILALVALPLSLALDGTDWAAGFAGWTPGDWCMLLLGGTILYAGQMWLLNVIAWKLGAPLVSMLYGLRLVASILLSMAILGVTVIQTGLQIAGAVLTVLSVTIYAAQRWFVSRQAARAALVGGKSTCGVQGA